MTDVILCGVEEKQAKRVRDALAKAGDLTIGVDDEADDDLVARLAADRPNVVALGPGLNGRDRFEMTRALAETDPTIAVLIVDPPTEALLASALEAGARGLLAPEASTAETRATFERVIAMSRRLRDRQDAAAVEPERRTIVVASAKGGAGKTVIAVNLAVAIALTERRQAAIVDLDLQFGDVASALLLAPEHTIADAVEAAEVAAAGATALKVFLTRHAPTDLFALCAPESPATADEIPVAKVSNILEALSREFRHQIIDTAAGLGEHTLAALDKATDIVVVVDLDVPSVRGGRKFLEALDEIGLRTARRHIVLNRADSKVGLDPGEVAAVLSVPIDITLPSSRDIPLSYNEGRPLVLARPRHPFARGIQDLAYRMTRSGAYQGVNR
jgi:pilus assembly protein CpaE